MNNKTPLAFMYLSTTIGKNRIKVKAFKNELERREWMEKNDNGPNIVNLPHWIIPQENDTRFINVVKSGTYVHIAGQYHNIKGLDPTVMAHCG
jgi:hypothetical protein